MKSIHEYGSIQARDGLELFISRDIPENPRAVLVIVHGLAEHSGRYDYVAEKFQNAGFGVIRFDNRGHGKSRGDRAWIESFQEYIDDANSVVNRTAEEFAGIPLFLMGHSMGGFIATGYAIKYPGKVQGQIFSGAAVGPLSAFDFLRDMDYKAHGRDPLPNGLGHLVSRDPAVVSAYAQDPLVLKSITTQLAGSVWKDGVAWIEANAHTINVPALILHGGDDQIVPPAASEWLYNQIASTDKSLKIYPGLYHEILNDPEKDQVISDIVAWVQERI